jgi:hypothetical protein
MIGRHGSTRTNGRLSGRFRQWVSILCALSFMVAGIAHAGHGAFATSAAAPAVMMDATDDGQDSIAKERVGAEACHCCASAVMPVATAAPDRSVARTLPAWTGHRLLSLSPFAEPPPPRILT